MTLVVLVAIWIILGLLAGLAAGSIWSEKRPLGDTADYIIAILAAVLTGLADWYILPLIGIEGTVRFITSVIEPPLVSLFALWLVRKLKRKPAE